MKQFESKVMYLIVGVCVGALIVTANPLVDQLPDWKMEQLP